MSGSSIHSLPPELVQMVTTYLDIQDYSHLKYSSSRLHSVLSVRPYICRTQGSPSLETYLTTKSTLQNRFPNLTLTERHFRLSVVSPIPSRDLIALAAISSHELSHQLFMGAYSPCTLQKALVKATETDSIDSIESIINHIALTALTTLNVDCPDKRDVTALQVAVQHNHISLTRSLLEMGANPNHQPRTLLLPPPLLLSLDASLEMTALLLEKGANPNITSSNGLSLLMETLQRGDGERVRVVVQYGASTGEKTRRGETCRQVALRSGQIALFTSLQSSLVL